MLIQPSAYVIRHAVREYHRSEPFLIATLHQSRKRILLRKLFHLIVKDIFSHIFKFNMILALICLVEPFHLRLKEYRTYIFSGLIGWNRDRDLS